MNLWVDAVSHNQLFVVVYLSLVNEMDSVSKLSNRFLMKKTVLIKKRTRAAINVCLRDRTCEFCPDERRLTEDLG